MPRRTAALLALFACCTVLYHVPPAAAAVANATVARGTPVNFSLATNGTFVVQDTLPDGGPGMVVRTSFVSSAVEHATYVGAPLAQCDNNASDLEPFSNIRLTQQLVNGSMGPLQVALGLVLDLSYLPYRTDDRDLVVCHHVSGTYGWYTVEAGCGPIGYVSTTSVVGNNACAGSDFAVRRRHGAKLRCPPGRYGCRCASSVNRVTDQDFEALWWVGLLAALAGIGGTSVCLFSSKSWPYRMLLLLGVTGAVAMALAYAFYIPHDERPPGASLEGEDLEMAIAFAALVPAALVLVIYLGRPSGGDPVSDEDYNEQNTCCKGIDGEKWRHDRWAIWLRVFVYVVICAAAGVPASATAAAVHGDVLLLRPMVYGAGLIVLLVLGFCIACGRCRPKRCCRNKDSEVGEGRVIFAVMCACDLILFTALVYEFALTPCDTYYMQ